MSVVKGEDDGDVRGWRSRYYGLKEPVPSVVCEIETVLPHRFVSAFYPEGSVRDVILGDMELRLIKRNGKEDSFHLNEVGNQSVIAGFIVGLR